MIGFPRESFPFRPTARFHVSTANCLGHPAKAATLIASASVSRDNTRLDLTATNAFGWLNGIDLSAYQDGNYKLVILDSASRALSGFIKAATPAGETPGGEMLSNVGFETLGGGGTDIWYYWKEEIAGGGALADESVLVHGGGHAVKITRGTANYTLVNTGSTINWTARFGQLMRLSMWTRGDGTNAGRYNLYQGSGGGVRNIIPITSTGVSGATYSLVTGYGVVPLGATAGGPNFIDCDVTGGICYFDDVSLQSITDPPSTGVHIVSAMGGAARAWTSEASGFNRNDSSGYTYQVYKINFMIPYHLFFQRVN